MAKITQLPSKNMVDAFRGKLDFYVWCDLTIVRKWPHAPGRNRSPEVVATQAPFAYINQLASTLPPNVVDTYKELASDSGMVWKDYLTRLYINGSIDDTMFPKDEDYVFTGEKNMRIVLLDPEVPIVDIDNEDTSHPWTDIDLSAEVPASATHVIVRALLQWNAAAAAGSLNLFFREKGSGLGVSCCGHWCNRTGGIQRNNDVIVGLDANKEIQYQLNISAGINDVWVNAYLIGYYYEVG